MTQYTKEFMNGFNLAKAFAEGEAQWCRANGESDMRCVISRIR